MIAIPWYFINQIKEESLYNLVFFVVTLATLFWAQYAGTLIDKYDRKSIFQGLCLVGLIILTLAGFSPYFGVNNYTPIAVIVFCFTVLNYNIHYPALYALAQELSEGKMYGKINSWLEIQGQATSMLSGAAAAILISGNNFYFGNYELNINAWSLNEIFLMDASTYLIAFSLLLFLRSKSLNNFNRDTGSIGKRLKQGWQFLAENKLILNYGLFSYFVFVTVIVHVFYLLHLYVSNHLLGDGKALAAAQISHTAGALLAGVFIQKLNKKYPAVLVTLILMILIVAVYLLSGATQSVLIYALCCGIIGFANSGVRVTRVTFLFSVVPKKTIGRVTSAFQSANIALRLLLIALLHLPFFVQNPASAYYFYAGFILLAMLPMITKYRAILNFEKEANSKA